MSMKLVWNKSDCSLELDGLTVVAAPSAFPPFPCEAVVEEQDTQLTLGEQTVLKDPGKPTWYLSHTMERDNGHSLGSIVLSGKSPLRLLAIVHDLDQDPTCETESIQQAYLAIIQIAAERKLTSLAVPLLGTVYGKLADIQSIRLLREAIQQACPKELKRIWLILAEGSTEDSKALLARLKTE